MSEKSIIEVLKSGGIAVMPTDTLYGIVGDALDSKVVERIYTARKRNPEKPCIILIADENEFEKFSISISEEQKKKIKKYWKEKERPTSIVLDCENDDFLYLHRGTKTLAFRLPQNPDLQELLNKTGPLIAPSANLEGLPPAKNVAEAKKYFGDSVDLYIDGGEIAVIASKVIRLRKDGSIDILRK